MLKREKVTWRDSEIWFSELSVLMIPKLLAEFDVRLVSENITAVHFWAGFVKNHVQNNNGAAEDRNRNWEEAGSSSN